LKNVVELGLQAINAGLLADVDQLQNLTKTKQPLTTKNNP